MDTRVLILVGIAISLFLGMLLFALRLYVSGNHANLFLRFLADPSATLQGDTSITMLGSHQYNNQPSLFICEIVTMATVWWWFIEFALCSVAAIIICLCVLIRGIGSFLVMIPVNFVPDLLYWLKNKDSGR